MTGSFTGDRPDQMTTISRDQLQYKNAAGMPAVDPTLEDRAIGAYLGLAIGDALGATTEFLTPWEIRHKYGVHRHLRGGGWLNLHPGQVTDDTEMSLALGRSILEGKGVEAHGVASAFSDWMRTKPVDIGNTVRRGLVHYRTTGEASVPVNEFDAGNGACMRTLPVALAYWNAAPEEIQRASLTQSHVTHNSPLSDAGTETVTLMVIAAMKGDTKAQLRHLSEELVRKHQQFRFDRKDVENPSGWIVETLQTVFQAFFRRQSFEEVLVDVVNRGGDSDTTGAIAGMICGAFYGKGAIPRAWLQALSPRVSSDCVQQSLDLIAFANDRLVGGKAG